MLLGRPVDELDRKIIERIARDNNFVIEGPLGGGCFGVAYAVRENRKGGDFYEPLAMKVHQYSSHRQDEDISVDRHFLESLMNNWVDHPNIVPVREVGIMEDFMYMVMPRALGGSVVDVIRNNPKILTDEVMATIVYQVAEGLEALDRAGIEHYDILRQNVFLMKPVTGEASSVHAVIGDFGRGKLLKEFDAKPVGEFGPEVNHNHYFMMDHIRAGIRAGTWRQEHGLRPVEDNRRADRRVEASMRAFEAASRGLTSGISPFRREYIFGREEDRLVDVDAVEADVSGAIVGDPGQEAVDLASLRSFAEPLDIPDHDVWAEEGPWVFLQSGSWPAVFDLRRLSVALVQANTPFRIEENGCRLGSRGSQPLANQTLHDLFVGCGRSMAPVEYAMKFAEALGVTPLASPEGPVTGVRGVVESCFVDNIHREGRI